MNRMWVRISLTYVGIVVFIILIPLTIGIATRSFGLDELALRSQNGGEITTDNRLFGPGPRFLEAEFPGLYLVGELLRVLLGVAVMGSIVGIVSSRGLTAPLSKLAEAAKAIGSHNLDRRVEVKGSVEIRAVAQAFNEMAAALQKAETLRGNLLNDVAHELRTPVTVIQGSLRAILDDVYELDKAEIARLYDQTRHLSRLVDDLRELAQAEADQLPLNLTRLEVVPWIQEAAAAFRSISTEKGVTVRVEILGEHPHIQVDKARLTQSLHNLLNNALQHTPAGGTVTIQVEQCPEVVYLRVQDTGTGIEPEHIPHVFDRFYRADPARARETGGTGLGLAITRAIVEAHGGKITVASQGPGEGSVFTIQLPLQG